ncbi:MAG TPA: glycosyltransferase family 39 protein, partial [Patescibacteria group bacterium]|nr:glycosyltransferase family 39 protein [Patescibacteria group bacterium]
MKSFIERFKSLKCVICNNQRLLSGAGLGAVIVLALALRLYMPINDKSIGEIDVYFWGIRTQQLESFGANNAGTSLWVFPLFMAIIHNIFGGSLYDIFLWTGPIFSAIVPTIFIYFLTKEVSSSRMAGVFAGLIYAVSPLVFYRGVFTVSETLAYALIPLNLFLAIRLYKKKNLVTFLGLLLALFLAYNEHD